MFHELLGLRGFAVRAADGDCGRLSDVYFDDQRWLVRHLVVRIGGRMSRRRVLISPRQALGVDWQAGRVSVPLTKAALARCPGPSSHPPVSRQLEERYFRSSGWLDYGNMPFLWSAFPLSFPQELAATPAAAPLKPAPLPEPHLRSANVVKGFQIRASDGDLGHVHDFVLDDETWTLPFLVVGIGRFFSCHRTLVAARNVTAIRWSEGVVRVNLTARQVKGNLQLRR